MKEGEAGAREGGKERTLRELELAGAVTLRALQRFRALGDDERAAVLDELDGELGQLRGDGQEDERRALRQMLGVLAREFDLLAQRRGKPRGEMPG